MQLYWEGKARKAYISLSFTELTELQAFLYNFSPSLANDNQLPAQLYRRIRRLLNWYFNRTPNAKSQGWLFPPDKPAGG